MSELFPEWEINGCNGQGTNTLVIKRIHQKFECMYLKGKQVMNSLTAYRVGQCRMYILSLADDDDK